MPNIVTILTLAAAISAAAMTSTLADREGGGGDIGGGQQAWGTSPGQNPEDFPDCMVWSGKDKSYVWICGPPFPPNMPHR